MPATQQILRAIQVERLKGLRHLPEFRFDHGPLTAITGANGSGKSTILHALACSFRPNEGVQRRNFRFPDFFIPTSDSRWNGSRFSVTYDFRLDASVYENQVVTFAKADRWTPRYGRRPERHVVYLGVASCVPTIEQERLTTYLELTTEPHADAGAAQVIEWLGSALNKQYNALTTKNHWTGRSYRGVESNGVAYSSLSMGAGEQRLLEIFTTLYQAPPYSLVLVDELDLLLHEDALKRAIGLIHDRAVARNLQVVFTTHRESILRMEDRVAVHHIFQTPARTMVVRGTTPDAQHRLTGVQLRPIEVFVEDDLSRAIVEAVASELSGLRFISTTPVGAAANVITVLAGMILRGWDLNRSKFLLDGDVWRTPAQKSQEVKRVLTGDAAQDVARREQALERLIELRLPVGFNPEQYIHRMIRGLPDDGLDAIGLEIRNIALEILAVQDRHQYVNAVIDRLGMDRSAGLWALLRVAALAPDWQPMTQSIREWLDERIIELAE